MHEVEHMSDDEVALAAAEAYYAGRFESLAGSHTHDVVAIARRALREKREAEDKLARVRQALWEESRDHHGDASCTERCIEALRSKIEAAIADAGKITP